MRKNVIEDIYELLLQHYGPQNWWPADSPFEVMVGAVLTQNTNWQNVAKAITNLKATGYLSYDSMLMASDQEIADCIRPAGYYNLKTTRLKNLLAMIAEYYNEDPAGLLTDETSSARGRLLAVKGIGPETADAILLYAGKHPLFVVDAYTHRILWRHNLVAEQCDYFELQEEFMTALAPDWQLFNEYHALLVRVGKEYCKKTKPLCRLCPLQNVNGVNAEESRII